MDCEARAMGGIICKINLGPRAPNDIRNLIALLRYRGAYSYCERITSEDFSIRKNVQGTPTVILGILSDMERSFEENMSSGLVACDSVFPKDIASIVGLGDGPLVSLLKQGDERVASISGMVVLVIDSEGVTVWRSGDGQKAIYVGSKDEIIVLATEKKILWHDNLDGVRAIEPYETLTVGWDGTLKSRISNSHRGISEGITQEAAIELLAKYLKNSISKVVGDKTGILFSGGVDSALLAHLLNQKSGKAILVSSSAEGARDRTHTEDAARILGMDIKSVEITSELVWSILPEVVYAAETDNRMDIEIALPFFLCSKEGRKLGVKYMVSGQGPDELFAGYARHVRLFETQGPRALEKQLRQEVAVTHEANISRDERVIAAHGLQAFFPYLDPRFTQLALSLPADWKVRPNETPERKVLFRHLARRMGLPDILANTPKKATQYSSGSSKMLTKAISSHADFREGLTKKEIEISCKEVLNNIAWLLGFPLAAQDASKSKYNLEPTYRFIKARGIIPQQ